MISVPLLFILAVPLPWTGERGEAGQCLVSQGPTAEPIWDSCSVGGAAAWGDITGTLADQTDLQSALDGKEASGAFSGTGVCAANTFASTLNDGAAPTCTQPSFANLSGSATDGQIPNNITIDLATAANALSANGGNCSGNEFALGVNASGVSECAQPAFSNLSGSATDAQIPNTITITLAGTATALASDPSNCGANNFATGINASGVADCAQPSFSNLSGSIAAAQLPNPGATAKGGIEAETCSGTDKISAINTDGTVTCSADELGGGGGVNDATYITQTANGTLTNEQALGSLATGILRNTTTTGVLSIAAAGDFPTLNQNTTGTAANVTGTVAIANGGTGQTSQTAAFDALSPATTGGDIIYHNGTDNVRLAKGTAGQVLTVNAGATAPEWATPAGGSSNTTFARLAANSALSTTTKTNLSGLSFTLLANTNYSFECQFSTTANAATVGVQFAASFGGTVTNVIGTLQAPGAATTLLWFSDTSFQLDFNPLASQGNVAGLVLLSGTVEVSGTGGTLQFMHGSETATLTTVLRGSWCMLAKY